MCLQLSTLIVAVVFLLGLLALGLVRTALFLKEKVNVSLEVWKFKFTMDTDKSIKKEPQKKPVAKAHIAKAGS